MAKFNISDYVKDVSVSNSDTVRMIPIGMIRNNPANFYDTSNFKDLADSIDMNGLLDPLVVYQCDDTMMGHRMYRLISGHRRLRAINYLMTRSPEHLEKWKQIPCIVVPDPEDPVREKLMLIQANSTGRVLTGMEIARQARELTDCLVKLKERGVELPGRMRDIVAEQMQISSSKLARAQATEKNLRVPGLVEAWKKDELNESVAYELSQIPERDQYKALDQIIDSGKAYKELTAADVKKIRAKIERHESTRLELHAAAEFRNIRITGDDFTPLWMELLRKSGIPEVLRRLRFTSREEAVQHLYRKYGFTHAGHGSAELSYDCAPNGLTIRQPVNHRLSWQEVFDVCALIALAGDCGEAEDDDELTEEPGGASWHRCLREEPEDGQLVAVIYLNEYRPGQYDQSIMRYVDGEWFDDFYADEPCDDQCVTSCDFWTPLPELPEVD